MQCILNLCLLNNISITQIRYFIMIDNPHILKTDLKFAIKTCNSFILHTQILNINEMHLKRIHFNVPINQMKRLNVKAQSNRYFMWLSVEF